LPRYDYRCKECDREFEAVHGIHDNVEECRFCGGEVRRVFHPVGIVLKGPGFYATDSRKPGDSSKPPSDEATPTPAKKEEKKEDKKPDDSVKAAT